MASIERAVINENGRDLYCYSEIVEANIAHYFLALMIGGLIVGGSMNNSAITLRLLRMLSMA